MNRYLVDTDQEIEGINVIADFQGRARDHEKVLAEYKEIRDAVLADVSTQNCSLKGKLIRKSVRLAIDRTKRFGDDTGHGC